MNRKQLDFMARVVPAAQASARRTGVPASITLAQAILESGWGMTKLARDCNNYFGIKANAEQIAAGKYCEFPTQEVENGKHIIEDAKFARYASLEESFIAHGRLLCRSHYAPAMACASNPDKFAWALGPKTSSHPEGCGYSTLPQYHDRLMKLVRLYKLTQYDVPKTTAAGGE